MKLLITTCAGLATLLAFPAAAQTVVSEDFTNGFGVFTPTPGAAIDLRMGSPTYTDCCSATGSAVNLSNQFAVFGVGNVPNSGRLSTTFDTVLGKLYDVTFDYLVLGAGSESLFYSISHASGSVTGRIYASANNDFDTNLVPFTTLFLGYGEATTLAFYSPEPGFNVDVGVDNVNVSGVPEPATWAMMLVGFGMIGAGLRYRRKSTAVRFA